MTRRTQKNPHGLAEAAGIAVGLARIKGNIPIQDVLVSEIQAIQDRFAITPKTGVVVLATDGLTPYNGGGVTTGGTWAGGYPAAVLGHAASLVSNGTDVTASTSGSSTTMTIASVAAGGVAVAAGQYVSGPGVVDGTTIQSLGTSTGGPGTVTLSQAANIPAGSAVRLANGRKDMAFAITQTGDYDLYAWWSAKSSVSRSSKSPADVFDLARGTVSRTYNHNGSGGEGGNKVYMGRYLLRAPDAIGVGSTSGSSTTLTLASVSFGAAAAGLYVFGQGIPYGTTISALGTSTGGAGTVTLSAAATGPAGSAIVLSTSPHARLHGAAGGATWKALMAEPATA